MAGIAAAGFSSRGGGKVFGSSGGNRFERKSKTRVLKNGKSGGNVRWQACSVLWRRQKSPQPLRRGQKVFTAFPAFYEKPFSKAFFIFRQFFAAVCGNISRNHPAVIAASSFSVSESSDHGSAESNSAAMSP